jgi:hypothetical protein
MVENKGAVHPIVLFSIHRVRNIYILFYLKNKKKMKFIFNFYSINIL